MKNTFIFSRRHRSLFFPLLRFARDVLKSCYEIENQPPTQLSRFPPDDLPGMLDRPKTREDGPSFSQEFDMDRLKIVVCWANGEAVFSSFIVKMALELQNG